MNLFVGILAENFPLPQGLLFIFVENFFSNLNIQLSSGTFSFSWNCTDFVLKMLGGSFNTNVRWRRGEKTRE